jgi:hypothetical protein
MPSKKNLDELLFNSNDLPIYRVLTKKKEGERKKFRNKIWSRVKAYFSKKQLK